MARAFAHSYLADEPAAHAFFAPAFRERSARQQVTVRAAQRGTSPVLLQVLREQQSAFAPSPARVAHLDALAAGRAAVVVTGQQVGLFLGPLYSFYKAASAVAVARALAAETGIACVPLFWLQTEDHDFAEIRTAVVPGPDGEPLRLSLPDAEPGAARSSVAHRVLPAEIVELLDQLAAALPPGRACDETLAILRAAYRPGRGMAAAFAEVMATLFADDGLLVFDPRRAAVAQLAAPIYRACLDDAEVIASKLRQRGAALAAAGFAEQVAIRDHTALIFFHPDGAAGARFRLERREGNAPTWRCAGGAATLEHQGLLDLVAREPLRFSTSSLLRPIVQDLLLPTVAYVGGPGEINYFAQLPPLYDHYGLPLPLLVPRARFRCLDARTRRLLAASGLGPDDLALPLEELGQRCAVPRPRQAPDPQALRALVEERIAPAVEEIAAAIERAEPGLGREAERARTRVRYRLDRLLGRYARALVERDHALANKLRRAAQWLFPERTPQERLYGWPAMAARLGVAAFTQLVRSRLADPFVPAVQDLEL